ncbi:hypothetical protein ABZT06_50495, partial [Streptomyces sp. NPDC005483]|uniref:hypothetical protein n=1 Tax=Streptomyces sp. NPDC005483 TaxID=3154882 RepID=UPI0033AADE11
MDALFMDVDLGGVGSDPDVAMGEVVAPEEDEEDLYAVVEDFYAADPVGAVDLDDRVGAVDPADPVGVGVAGGLGEVPVVAEADPATVFWRASYPRWGGEYLMAVWGRLNSHLGIVAHEEGERRMRDPQWIAYGQQVMAQGIPDESAPGGVRVLEGLQVPLYFRELAQRDLRVWPVTAAGEAVGVWTEVVARLAGGGGVSVGVLAERLRAARGQRGDAGSQAWDVSVETEDGLRAQADMFAELDGGRWIGMYLEGLVREVNLNLGVRGGALRHVPAWRPVDGGAEREGLWERALSELLTGAGVSA